jgi:hypothetical protein
MGEKKEGAKIVQKRHNMRKLYGVADDILHIDSEEKKVGVLGRDRKESTP